MSVVFKDYSKIVINKFNNNAVQWLEEASGELEAQTKRNTKVDTGKTKTEKAIVSNSDSEGSHGYDDDLPF